MTRALPLTCVLCLAGCVAHDDVTVDATADNSGQAGHRADAGTVPDARPIPDADLGAFCSEVRACPAPLAGHFMICGRILDVRDSAPVIFHDAEQLRVGFVDAAALVQDPATLPDFRVSTDECGRFLSADAAHVGVTVPSSGRISVVVRDDMGAFTPTVITLSALRDAQATDVRAYATRAVQDEDWSIGQMPSFVTRGVLVSLFLNSRGLPAPPYPGEPFAGVAATVNGSVLQGNDFYFSDPALFSRLSVDALQDTTGVNGTALLVDIGQAEISGAAAPVGCAWPQQPAGTIPGLVQVAEFVLACN
jgi:hypothetical protein